MIRREPSPSEKPESWVLISQVDHANLAGQLAEHWGAAPFATPLPRDELLWSIHHHDDGWRTWEQAPAVDPGSGTPVSFTEMNLEESLAIWSESIDLAAVAGPLQAYLIAGHFSVLARRVAARGEQDQLADGVVQFFAKYEAQRQGWLDEWQSKTPRVNTARVAEMALALLQFFDLLSLWFCCAPAVRTARLSTPGGPDVTIRPLDPEQLRVWPWPLVVDSLEIGLSGRAVPWRRYSDRADLSAAQARPVRLRWSLAVDDQKS